MKELKLKKHEDRPDLTGEYRFDGDYAKYKKKLGGGYLSFNIGYQISLSNSK